MPTNQGDGVRLLRQDPARNPERPAQTTMEAGPQQDIEESCCYNPLRNILDIIMSFYVKLAVSDFFFQQKMPKSRLDQTEMMIIRLLQEDGRLSTAEMARRIGVSEPTARKKLAHLQEERIIRVTAIADPIDLGYDAPAYIGLDVERSKIREVADAIAAYPTVSSVAVATGPYDIIIEASFKSIPELYDFVLRELARHKGIKDSHSFIVLQRFKQDEHRGVAGLSPEMLDTLSLSDDQAQEDVCRSSPVPR